MRQPDYLAPIFPRLREPTPPPRVKLRVFARREIECTQCSRLIKQDKEFFADVLQDDASKAITDLRKEAEAWEGETSITCEEC